MAITAFDRPGSGRVGSRPPDVPDGCGALGEEAREPVTAVLAAALLEPLAESARRRCDTALDGIVAAGPPADLRDRLCLPLAAGTVADLLGAPAHRQAPLLAWVRGDLSGEELLAALRHLVASPDVLDNGVLIHCIRGIRAGALEPEELVRAAAALLATAPALADRLAAALQPAGANEAAPQPAGANEAAPQPADANDAAPQPADANDAAPQPAGADADAAGKPNVEDGPEGPLGPAPVRLVTEIAVEATARRLPGLAPVAAGGRLVTWAEARR